MGVWVYMHLHLHYAQICTVHTQQHVPCIPSYILMHHHLALSHTQLSISMSLLHGKHVPCSCMLSGTCGWGLLELCCMRIPHTLWGCSVRCVVLWCCGVGQGEGCFSLHVMFLHCMYTYIHPHIPICFPVFACIMLYILLCIIMLCVYSHPHSPSTKRWLTRCTC